MKVKVLISRYVTFDWFERLKGGWIAIEDDYGSDCLLISKINNTLTFVREKIRNDWQLTIKEGANKVSISIDFVYSVYFDGRIGYEKYYRKVCGKIVNRKPNRKSH